MKAKKQKEEMVRIIVNPSDASQDQIISRRALRVFFAAGCVVKDLTNGGWCTKNGQRLPLKVS